MKKYILFIATGLILFFSACTSGQKADHIDSSVRDSSVRVDTTVSKTPLPDSAKKVSGMNDSTSNTPRLPK